MNYNNNKILYAQYKVKKEIEYVQEQTNWRRLLGADKKKWIVAAVFVIIKQQEGVIIVHNKQTK